MIRVNTVYFYIMLPATPALTTLCTHSVPPSWLHNLHKLFQVSPRVLHRDVRERHLLDMVQIQVFYSMIFNCVFLLQQLYKSCPQVSQLVFVKKLLITFNLPIKFKILVSSI